MRFPASPWISFLHFQPGPKQHQHGNRSSKWRGGGKSCYTRVTNSLLIKFEPCVRYTQAWGALPSPAFTLFHWAFVCAGIESLCVYRGLKRERERERGVVRGGEEEGKRREHLRSLAFPWDKSPTTPNFPAFWMTFPLVSDGRKLCFSVWE